MRFSTDDVWHTHCKISNCSSGTKEVKLTNDQSKGGWCAGVYVAVGPIGTESFGTKTDTPSMRGLGNASCSNVAASH